MYRVIRLVSWIGDRDRAVESLGLGLGLGLGGDGSRDLGRHRCRRKCRYLGGSRSGTGKDRGELSLCRQGRRKTGHDGRSGSGIGRSNRVIFSTMFLLLEV